MLSTICYFLKVEKDEQTAVESKHAKEEPAQQEQWNEGAAQNEQV